MLNLLANKTKQAVKVLVVDDDPHMRLLLKRFLELKGYVIQEAEDGAKCLEVVNQDKPNLILLDNNMPNMNGKEALAHLKGSLKTKGIPVIMLTAQTEVSFVNSAHQGGAVDYVVKPFDYNVLLEKMEQALKTK